VRLRVRSPPPTPVALSASTMSSGMSTPTRALKEMNLLDDLLNDDDDALGGAGETTSYGDDNSNNNNDNNNNNNDNNKAIKVDRE
jgi:hypothetical protein